MEIICVLGAFFNFIGVLPRNETVKKNFWHFSVTYNLSFTKNGENFLFSGLNVL